MTDRQTWQQAARDFSRAASGQVEWPVMALAGLLALLALVFG